MLSNADVATRRIGRSLALRVRRPIGARLTP
jgi:hypothetical protein